MFRSLTLFLVLPLYMMAALCFFNTNLALFHRAAFQSRVRSSELSDLTVLTFSEQEYEGLNWTEKGREFKWQNKMFDISSIEKKGDLYLVTCKHDEMETFVVNTFSFLKKGASKSLPTKKRSRKNFPSQHFAQRILKTSLIENLQQEQYPEFSQKLPLFFEEVESPPPQTNRYS